MTTGEGKVIYIRQPEGVVELARLDDRTVLAHWHKRWNDREVVVEWRLELEGKPIAVRDKRTGQPTVVALHRFDEINQPPRQGERLDDGRWRIDVPMAWHTPCVAVSGLIRLELDEEKLEMEYSEDLHVDL